MYYNNKRLALNIFWIVLGAVLVGLSIAEVLDSSLYAGMGGALIGIGVLRLIMTAKYRTDPEYREKIDTSNDERAKYLRLKSWAWAGYIVVLVEGIGAIVAMILGARDIQLFLSYSVCLIITAYWIAYVILSMKY